MTVFFTSGSNGPSGGARVLNETVNLLRSRGIEAWLCLPAAQNMRPAFLEESAPTIEIEQISSVISPGDAIVFGWNTEAEYQLLTGDYPARKYLWQHGILVAQGPGLVGEKMLTSGLLDGYWNVSRECGAFIVEKYGLDKFNLVQPFFSNPFPKGHSEWVEFSSRRGVLVQERRGLEVIPRIEKLTNRLGISLKVLRAPFPTRDLELELAKTKFFVSFDRGLKYRLTPRDRIWYAKKSLRDGSGFLSGFFTHQRWVIHRKNLLGFPISAAQAAIQGAVVVGYPMGGGLEWMNTSNCFMAKDGSTPSLLKELEAALNTEEAELERISLSAQHALKQFSPQRTLDQLGKALSW